MSRPLFLTLDEVLSLHAEQIRLFGGSSGIPDLGLLESALGSVEATFDGAFSMRRSSRWPRRISMVSVETIPSWMETNEPPSQPR
jgi:hypothetical protein